MNFTIVIVSFAIVGIVGLICGMGLGVASEKFKVKVDEKELAVREALPGNNCGACGFPGCDGGWVLPGPRGDCRPLRGEPDLRFALRRERVRR